MIDSRGCPKAGNGQLGEIVVELKENKRLHKQGAAGLLFANKVHAVY
jgi:hypothetical protein